MMNHLPASLTPNKLPETSLEWVAWAAYLADSKKALGITVLETSTVTTLADYFLVCSGQSKTQVRAIAEEIAFAFKHAPKDILSDERDDSNTWCLLDFHDVVIHVMQEEARGFYQLEQFWNHARQLETSEWFEVAKGMGLGSEEASATA